MYKRPSSHPYLVSCNFCHLPFYGTMSSGVILKHKLQVRRSPSPCMHSEGYSSCSVCVSVSLQHSSGTHATNLQTRHSRTEYCGVRSRIYLVYNCSVAKL